MKYFLIFILVITNGHSQTGKVTYSTIMNFGITDADVNKETNNLYFTDAASYYQREIKETKKTDKTEERKEDSNNKKIIETTIEVGSDSIGDLVFHDLRNNAIICREAVMEKDKLGYYIYEDKIDIKWELFDEFKEISNYKCQKATTKFRGRNYEAWFTSEVPLSFGPWKFSGLPGLILEVYDQTGQVYFSVEDIKIPFPNAEKIVHKPSGDPTIDYREFVEKQNDNSAKITQAMIARLPKGSTLVSIKTKRNGIELEYPWEKE